MGRFRPQRGRCGERSAECRRRPGVRERRGRRSSRASGRVLCDRRALPAKRLPRPQSPAVGDHATRASRSRARRVPASSQPAAAAPSPVSLRQRGECVGQSRPRNDERCSGPSAGARIAVGGEARQSSWHTSRWRRRVSSRPRYGSMLCTPRYRTPCRSVASATRRRSGRLSRAVPMLLEMLTPPTHSKCVKLGPRPSCRWRWCRAGHALEAVAARERGEDVIILSVGDPDLETPAPVIERAIAVPRGRYALRAAAGQPRCAPRSPARTRPAVVRQSIARQRGVPRRCAERAVRGLTVPGRTG